MKLLRNIAMLHLNMTRCESEKQPRYQKIVHICIGIDAQPAVYMSIQMPSTYLASRILQDCMSEILDSESWGSNLHDSPPQTFLSERPALPKRRWHG